MVQREVPVSNAVSLQAFQELNTVGFNDGHNKTIVLMTDGIANLASVNSTFPMNAYLPSDYQSSQDKSATAATAAINLATTIKGQNIKIYTIGFGNNVDSATLTSIASPGCYYSASDGTSLATVYQTIYGQVFTDASVDTDVSMDFGTLIVNGANTPFDPLNPISRMCQTQPRPVRPCWINTTPPPTGQSTCTRSRDSTLIQDSRSPRSARSSSTSRITGTTSTLHPSITRTSPLAFNIGTVKVNETWATQFSLQVLREGDIQISAPSHRSASRTVRPATTA